MVCSPSGKLLPIGSPRPTTFHGADQSRGGIPTDARHLVGRTPALPCEHHAGSTLPVLRRHAVVVHSVEELVRMSATRQRPAQLRRVSFDVRRYKYSPTPAEVGQSPNVDEWELDDYIQGEFRYLYAG